MKKHANNIMKNKTTKTRKNKNIGWEKVYQPATDTAAYHKMGTHQKPKSPSIFVSEVKSIKTLQELLENIARDKYTLKSLNIEQVKIQPI